MEGEKQRERERENNEQEELDIYRDKQDIQWANRYHKTNFHSDSNTLLHVTVTHSI